MAFTSPTGDIAKPENSLVLVASALGTKESCLLPGTMLPSPPPDSSDQQPDNPASLISLGASDSSLLSGLCFPPPHVPLACQLLQGIWVGAGWEAETLQASPGGECGSPREEALGTTVSLVQALGLGLRECSPRHSGGHLCREGHAVLGRGFASGLLVFSYSARALRLISATGCS